MAALPRILALTIVAVTAAGCFGHYCADTARAQVWVQPEYWQVAMQDGNVSAVDRRWTSGLEWPGLDGAWRGNHSIRGFGMDLGKDHHLGFSIDENGTVGGLSAFVRAGMSKDQLKTRVLDLLDVGTDASPSVQLAAWEAFWSSREGDSSGQSLRAPIAGVGFDLEGVAGLGSWTVSPGGRAGFWTVMHEDWRVGLTVAWRPLYNDEINEGFTVDAGGYVRGPFLGVDLTEMERQAETARIAESWGFPPPVFAQASTDAEGICT